MVSESRVLLDGFGFLNLFRVQNGIVRVKHIEVADFKWFAPSGTDVALLYEDNAVRLHQLSGDQLEKRLHIQLNAPSASILWLAGRLLVTED